MAQPLGPGLHQVRPLAGPFIGPKAEIVFFATDSSGTVVFPESDRFNISTGMVGSGTVELQAFAPGTDKELVGTATGIMGADSISYAFPGADL